MKKLYLLFLFLIFSIFQAQIVNFADANFKAYLLTANTTNNQIAFNATGATIIDTNGNGQIELSEASAITRLNLKNNTLITNIGGIENFVNVFKIDISSLTNLQNFNLNSLPLLKFAYLTNLPQITSLNFGGSTLLNTLEISSCDSVSNLTLNSNTLQYLKLTYGGNYGNLDLTNCSILKELYIESTNVLSINVSNISTLNKLDVRSNNLLNGVNISGSNNLTLLSIGGSGNLQTLDISNKSILNEIRCQFNPALASLSISNCPNLNTIYANGNNLSIFNLSGTPNLQSLTIGDNNLSNVNLGSLPYVTYLQCSQNNLTSLDVSTLPALKFLYCTENNLTELNLQNNPAMMSMYCENNNLQYVSVKNGGPNPINTNFNGNPSLVYVCCDNEDISYYAANYYLSSNNVVINSYCSFTPGGDFYTIQGNAKFDSNNNGCDANDLNKSYQKFNITNGTVSGSMISNGSGNYTIPVQSGNHTITPILENPNYFTVSPTTLTVNFPAQTSPVNQNFCLAANGNHNDLEVVIIPVTAAAPGFDAKYKIFYKNKGTSAQSGTIVYNFNDNLMNFLNSTIVPNSQATGVLDWNFNNLMPFETREMVLNFKLNTPVQTPALNGGDILNYTAQINGLTDETPSDNIFTLNQTVVNSFDPNDKTCLEGTAITQAKVGDYVHYLIRFENTGTANAQNIVVKDEIDTSKLDLSSLIPLNGSHSFITRITNPNVIEFIFENIQLPFDDANNDGYISFKIKTKSTLNIGDSFSNLAKIYFDYNHPIITNNYTTTVQNVLSTMGNSTDKNSVFIYPNPVKDVLYMKSKNEIIKAEIYDSAGRIILSAKAKENSINVAELSKGSYMIKLFLKDHYEVLKFIKY